jgi:hypothetical protein
VAVLAAAGLFVRAAVRRSRPLGDAIEERPSTLGTRPVNLRAPVLLVIRPPSTGDSVVDAALRRSFNITDYSMARTFPGRIVGMDSVAALLRTIRARTKVAMMENEEVHELLRVTGAAGRRRENDCCSTTRSASTTGSLGAPCIAPPHRRAAGSARARATGRAGRLGPGEPHSARSHRSADRRYRNRKRRRHRRTGNRIAVASLARRA